MSALRTSVFQTARILPSHASRLLHQTAVSSCPPPPPPPYKDDMDRTSLRPRAHENTQSGTDDGAAGAGAAFDGRETAPGAERDAAAAAVAKHGNGGGSPLDASPADHKFAKGEGEGGAEEKPRPQQGGKGKRSGKGDTPKAGKVN
ncbi:hypothetical protein SAMD00023353_2500200 [Rosellinia necatrix]|uniref:Uncharacterized protein n=1 Tax=Rosellinia necatrix TaxID=77044 RepID=A0A1W2TG80_ROSNE|nr:hypothetical protein SAMD00023353_2500200 [Rosellinia necatrix]